MPQKRLTTNGNVFRRTDGRWQSVIWYFDEQGVKRRKVFSSKTKTEAQQKITTYIAQFNAEVRNSDESNKTVRESLTRWLQVFKFPSVERTTYDRLECTAQHQVFPLIGDKIVGDITAADLKSVLNHWMEQGYAYTTVKKVHNLLSEIFSLPYGRRFHSKESHAVSANDEESEFPRRPRQGLCAGARSRDSVYSNGNR